MAIQRSWDDPVVQASFDSLVDTAPNDSSKARLLAVCTPEAGAWLQALPVSSLGLRMEDSVVHISATLRLGLPNCVPHSCRNCGAHVDHFGHHGLTCKKGRGRFFRHSSLNDIINRALATAGVPSQLEPSGLARSDGKRPDGMSLVPWEKGKPLVWDVTILQCPIDQ